MVSGRSMAPSSPFYLRVAGGISSTALASTWPTFVFVWSARSSLVRFSFFPAKYCIVYRQVLTWYPRPRVCLYSWCLHLFLPRHRGTAYDPFSLLSHVCNPQITIAFNSTEGNGSMINGGSLTTPAVSLMILPPTSSPVFHRDLHWTQPQQSGWDRGDLGLEPVAELSTGLSGR